MKKHTLGNLARDNQHRRTLGPVIPSSAYSCGAHLPVSEGSPLHGDPMSAFLPTPNLNPDSKPPHTAASTSAPSSTDFVPLLFKGDLAG